MSSNNNAHPLRIQLPLSAPDGTPGALPDALRSASSRGARHEALALLTNVTVTATWQLAPASRSATAPATTSTEADQRLFALEAQDGSTVFIRGDALAQAIAKVHPEAVDEQGTVDLACLRDPEVTSRGLGDWLWKRISALHVAPDEITQLARTKLAAWLGGQAARLENDWVVRASTLGAKALMEAIEEQLAGPPGLYRWDGTPLRPQDLCPPADPRLSGWGKQPVLLFIHGTGSHTLGGFGDLPVSEDWATLSAPYQGRIFAYEHRTFSQSPIDNALELVQALPEHATLHLVTHSRGGLVGDLLCLGTYSADTEALISQFRREPRPDELEHEAQDATGLCKTLREQTAHDEQQKLRALLQALDKKDIRVERYVRVACPAAGTALLSDNLDVFLSSLLELVRRGGAWLAGAAVGAVAGPAVGAAAKEVFARGLHTLARIVIEIADKRMAPQLVPGIEAMLPESPMGMLLARAPRRPGVAMAVITGDIEGGGILKRIGVTFTDWMFFDRADNDLVVDTRSMYAGIAQHGAHALFDQGPEVSHFTYFQNRRTRTALKSWLTEEDPRQSVAFTEMASLLAEQEARSRGAPPLVTPPDSRPVLIYLPGIMGSNLKVTRTAAGGRPGLTERIWLDLLKLPLGGIGEIAMDRTDLTVEEDDVVDLAYGRLARHLALSHNVIRFAYDWRQPNEAHAERLANTVRKALKDNPSQPVRILAHSMGGLVTRRMLLEYPDVWEDIARRDGGRLVMLGTPHHGSHLMVETLLGRSHTMRMLARIDLRHTMQALLDILSAYPGALQLLPQPGFDDSRSPLALKAQAYYEPAQWSTLSGLNNDGWFGRELGARPAEGALSTAQAFWHELAAKRQDLASPLPHTDRIAYVYGQSPNTPCGLILQKDASGTPRGLAMLGTPHGDGSVSWASGTLQWLPADRCWLMPVDHSAMVNTPDHFDEVVTLLQTGQANKLGRLPVARGDMGVVPTRVYQPGPPPGYPTDRELVAALVGGQATMQRPKASRTTLRVLVRADDLRLAHIPVMCGHYIGDPIAGAEWVIDQCLVDEALTQRENLGVHAGPLGTTSLVLMPRSHEDILRGTGRGALVVGMGELGKLSAEQLRETVRAGVLRRLLHAAGRDVEQGLISADAPSTGELRLASVLLGYNSTTHISVEDAVSAVTLGVIEANRQYMDGVRHRAPMRVASLEFIEQYEDVAITAARAVMGLGRKLASQLQAAQVSLEAADELLYGSGVRQRMGVEPSAFYWPRLMVTAAAPCGPDETPPPTQPYPDALRYVFLSERARADMRVQQRQPGLIEKLVAAEIMHTAHNPELGIGRTLFHLMVPLSFKAAARETSRLVLVVDEYTANLPWEMLIADEGPMVLQTRMVRQLASATYRLSPRGTRLPSAYVVINPSTAGYFKEFDPARAPEDPAKDQLPALTGSEEEGDALCRLLVQGRYELTISRNGDASDVIGRLYARPYRVLVVMGHGMFQVRDRLGKLRSGVVLSDGAMLTAAEVDGMENVPELVFLNCCHLGAIGAAHNKLAYSLARELIEMGVRCVVAAGWEVDDRAAATFSTTFFNAMLAQRRPFGEALFEARRACHAGHPGRNTWGAYQAYGDPDFVLDQGSDGADGRWAPVSPVELIDWLGARLRDARHSPGKQPSYEALQADVRQRLAAAPQAWLERADVQFALGELHGAHGESGFAAACEAYFEAIGADTRCGVAPIRAIEQLANLQARSATKLIGRAIALEGAPQERDKLLADADKRVEDALSLLKHLHELMAHATGQNGRPNTERASLLGSAYKSKARIQLAQGQAWKDIRRSLMAARDAYAHGEGLPSSPGFNPYGMINRLQLDAILALPVQDLGQLVTQCQNAARRRFANSFEFWDGIMCADAQLALWLATEPPADLPSPEEAVQPLVQLYQEEVRQLKAQPREFDSVVGQIELLAQLIEAREVTGPSAAHEAHETWRAVTLRALAARLGGRPLPPSPTSAPSSRGASHPPAKSAKFASKPARAAKPAKSARATKAAPEAAAKPQAAKSKRKAGVTQKS